MLTGTDIRQARQAAGMSQAALARAVGVSMRSIGNYERGDTVPRNKLPVIERVLSSYLGTTEGPALADASDAELLAEIARRFERGHHVSPNTRAGVSPADEPTTPRVSDEESDSVRVVESRRSPRPDDPPEDQEERP